MFEDVHEPKAVRVIVSIKQAFHRPFSSDRSLRHIIRTIPKSVETYLQNLTNHFVANILTRSFKLFVLSAVSEHVFLFNIHFDILNWPYFAKIWHKFKIKSLFGVAAAENYCLKTLLTSTFFFIYSFCLTTCWNTFNSSCCRRFVFSNQQFMF